MFYPSFRDTCLKNLKAYILHHFIKRNQQRNKVACKIIKNISNKHVQTGSNRIKMDQNRPKNKNKVNSFKNIAIKKVLKDQKIKNTTL